MMPPILAIGVRSVGDIALIDATYTRRWRRTDLVQLAVDGGVQGFLLDVPVDERIRRLGDRTADVSDAGTDFAPNEQVEGPTDEAARECIDADLLSASDLTNILLERASQRHDGVPEARTRGSFAVVKHSGLSERIRAAGVERKLKAGQALFRMGDVPAVLFEVVKGRVRLVRTDASGRETVLYTAGPGNVVSEASLFSPIYHCNAIAATPAAVRVYPKALLFAEFRRDPDAAQAFMAMLAREIMSLRTRLEIGNIHSARERVRHYLALNLSADRKTVFLPGSVKEWAASLGLTHEALYRTLAAMQKDGEIRRIGTQITLLATV